MTTYRLHEKNSILHEANKKVSFNSLPQYHYLTGCAADIDFLSHFPIISGMNFTTIVFFIVLVVMTTGFRAKRCPRGVADCPLGCACSEHSLCIDKVVYGNATLACNKKFGCARAVKKDTDDCIDCYEMVTERALVPCLPEPSVNASKSQYMNQTADHNKQRASCVSSAWLLERNLHHATLGSSGIAKVICLPDSSLPCGTPGHILRNAVNGRLVTYREVCAHRSGCIHSTMLVSKLSHSFDWSEFKTLTSVSVHPSSSVLYLSRIVAAIANGLNRRGFGAVCNLISYKIPFWFTSITISMPAFK